MAAKKTVCDTRADNRKAQKKFQDKQPAGKQAAAVKKSAAKPSTKSGGGSKSAGAGKHGGKIGRPRKDC